MRRLRMILAGLTAPRSRPRPQIACWWCGLIGAHDPLCTVRPEWGGSAKDW
jgi:hypothetical protein